MAPFASTERRATALYGPAHRPAANRLRASHKLSDEEIRTMVEDHFRLFKYIQDEGASGLALKIYEDGIFKPTPRRHVEENTESGSRWIDRLNEDIDDRKQHKAVGGL